MVLIVVVHGFQEQGGEERPGGGPAFPIYCSQFYSELGNDATRVEWEQGIASAVAKQLRFRSYSSCFTQQHERPRDLRSPSGSDQGGSAVPIISHAPKPSVRPTAAKRQSAAGAKVAPTRAHLTAGAVAEESAATRRQAEELMAEEAVRRQGAMIQEEGLVRLSSSCLAGLEGGRDLLLVWKQFQRCVAAVTAIAVYQRRCPLCAGL